MIGNQHLWGESWTIYRDKSVWVVGFRGQEGGASALHLHYHMAQSIFVSRGVLVVSSEGGWIEQLHPGHILKLDAKATHQLIFHCPVEGIETYYALPGHEIDENDIVRLSPGSAPEEAPEPDAASVRA